MFAPSILALVIRPNIKTDPWPPLGAPANASSFGAICTSFRAQPGDFFTRYTSFRALTEVSV